MEISRSPRPGGSSKYASTEVPGGATKLSSLPLQVNDIAKAHKLVPVLSTMQYSEYHGGAYDPSEKYTYQDLEQPHHDDLINKKTIMTVDEMCRLKMLDWSSKVSRGFTTSGSSHSFVATTASITSTSAPDGRLLQN